MIANFETKSLGTMKRNNMKKEQTIRNHLLLRECPK